MANLLRMQLYLEEILYLAGRMSKNSFASASSPLEGLINFFFFLLTQSVLIFFFNFVFFVLSFVLL